MEPFCGKAKVRNITEAPEVQHGFHTSRAASMLLRVAFPRAERPSIEVIVIGLFWPNNSEVDPSQVSGSE